MAPKLYYFDLYGRAEPIRWAFVLAGVEFEDIRVTGDSWKALKEEDGKLEFGQVPMLELDDGTKLCQGDAILEYLNLTLCKAGLQ
jgi:prostaglandin-H2 D-isomerase / glutathione transferase